LDTPAWFDDRSVLGKLSREQAITKLREMGEGTAAASLEKMREGGGQVFTSSKWWPFQDRPWQHTAHTFGHIAPAPQGTESISIFHASGITADPTLKNARIKISLGRLRVADYPGRGTHRVLFDFYSQNQIKANTEHLHFNAAYRVREGEQAAILGYPIFVGLNVGSEGVAFKCYTVNVKNEADESFLDFLESDIFKVGLKLTSTLQPAIAPLSGLAFALTKIIASRHRNVPVQEFSLGLDFNNTPFGARLAEGTYLAVQIPETLEMIWDWNRWVYRPTSGHVVNRDDPAQLIPYNYLAFNISRYEGE
jgi:hypothetical protein